MPDSNGHLTKFTHGVVCPICGGSEEDPRGNGSRCWGFLSDGWAHCTRIEFANGCDYHESSETFSHRLKGKCKCGIQHGEAEHTNGKLGEIDCVYPYHDASGKVIFEVVRFRNPKDFRQRRPGQQGSWSIKGIEPVLYRLPEIVNSGPDRLVWICEGEKDADSLARLGRIATCNPGGALKWKESYSEALRGRHCRISPHNDEKGRQHARQVAQSLAGKAASVKIVELPGLAPKGDVSDWLASGGTIADLDQMADARPFEDVNNDPLLNKDGKWIACLKNSEIWLERKAIAETVRYDRFLQAILIGEAFLSDELVISLTSRIETDVRVAWHQEHVRSALVNVASQHQFSSLTEWLDSLKWDGDYRVNTFFNEAYGCVHSPYGAECARVLFLSAVARAYQPGCQADVMVVLIGPQGLGKSMGIAALSPLPSWYADDLGCDLFEGKAGEGLQGKWIFEFSEFARVNRATMDAVKSFVSRRVDHYRPPYGRIARDFPRSCIFVGTTNDRHPLRDIENRRFMPIHCEQGDIAWIKANRDQLWAEAVARYQDGEKWWVDDPNLANTCIEVQESARMDDAWESMLEERLVGRERTTMEEAAEKLGIKPERLDKSIQTRIGIVLGVIGFARKQVREGSKRSYVYERKLSPHDAAF